MLSSDDLSNSNSHLVYNIPTKMVTSCENKAVLVTVYVEKPRRRESSNHHHHYLHHTIEQHKHGGRAGKGYDRRAELLLYSRRLRESARSAVSTSLQSKPVSPSDQQPLNKITTVERKPKYSKTPACFDNWGIILFPSFLRSLTKPQAKKSVKKTTHGGSASSNNNNKMKAVTSLQMQKKWRFFSKAISMFHKHR